MKLVRTSLKKHYKLVIFLTVILVIGLVSGFIYYKLVNESIVINLKNELVNLSFSWPNFFYHIIILGIIAITIFLGLGLVLALFILFYEALSIGFVIAGFTNFYGVSGFFYGIIYEIIFKLLFIIIFFCIISKIFCIAKNIIGYFLLKDNAVLKNNIIQNYVQIMGLSLVILVNDLFLVMLGDKLLSIFSFLI